MMRQEQIDTYYKFNRITGAFYLKTLADLLLSGTMLGSSVMNFVEENVSRLNKRCTIFSESEPSKFMETKELASEIS